MTFDWTTSFLSDAFIIKENLERCQGKLAGKLAARCGVWLSAADLPVGVSQAFQKLSRKLLYGNDSQTEFGCFSSQHQDLLPSVFFFIKLLALVDITLSVFEHAINDPG
jgi:hypothetical protein